MRKKIIIAAALLIVVITAVITKPDDKTIKIKTINALWGDVVPVPERAPQFYEDFMNTTTTNISIDDWVLLKRIRYQMTHDVQTVGFAAFGKVWIRK